MAISKLVCTWSGFIGAPGYSVFYATGNAGAQLLFKPFWDAIAVYLPAIVRISTPNTGDILDEATGKKTGTWSTGVTGVTAGTAAGGYGAASGMRVNWGTAAFVNGRRVQGKTYIVPAANVIYTANGDIAASTATAVNNAATSLFQNSGGSLVVWHRPVYDTTQHPSVLVKPGSVHPIISSAVPTKESVLTSRRDA